MRLIFGLVLIAGLGLAGFAVYMAKGVIGSSQARTAELQAIADSIVETVQVFVVKRKVKYGEHLEKAGVRLIFWPKNSLPEGVYTHPPQDTKDGEPGIALFPKDSDRLRAVLRTMEVDEPVLALKVTKPGRDAGITSRLTPGMRAFAIKVDVSSGVSGFLRPGDQVDIFWTGVPPSHNIDEGRASTGNITKLIQTSVRLVAIDQSANDDIGDTKVARTVTVEVTPRQVASLAQAQGSGRLSLALVGTGDVFEVGPIEIDQNDLLGIVARDIVEIEQKASCTIKTRRGAEVVIIEIPCTN
ncbi:pilus assembly protein CpaB [Marinosulfonomonas sp. PRT-SC04]|nr:pilus assembly protein CpaB [Marinosulfonomonas sp. PRT-SC04]